MIKCRKIDENSSEQEGGSSSCVVGDYFAGVVVWIGIVLDMSLERSRSRSPMDRKIRTQRYSYRDAPYRRDLRQGFSQNSLCKNCKRPGHFARECPNVAICHNCGLPGHIASECSTKSLCWNCREPGHMAGNCPNEGICHTCGKAGHLARDCEALPLPPGDLRLCNNCFKQGHIAADCTNDKACKNCRKTGHLARDCQNKPVCNSCNISGHVARDCPKGNVFDERGSGIRGGGYRDIVCRNCQQVGHMSRDCMSMAICHNCGGRGHMAFECPSGRFMDRFPRRY
ncbi:zinc finger GIS2-like [Olea europaea subsp. europaea]|uniref:Zinc finger GIS2-like n=2 Tax=Olea europaea subsp. europaea TaxID=158383 RepID=A0A8S0R4X6_OLEEU|nr:zinc finger GIS2-like [Olea europaea subsp. europaea]